MISADGLWAFLETYGYPAIVLGTILEGETILVLAGLLSFWGIFELPKVIIMGFLGSLAGDQFLFYCGRLQGGWFISKNKRLRERVEKIQRLLKKYQNLIIFGFCFLYGLRMVMPVVLGLDRTLKGSRFLILNGAGALIWSVLIASAGYFFAETMIWILKDLKKIKMIIP
jgi:membrane protein DedA with SNARE-associated domain